jgi:hypothetical protein
MGSAGQKKKGERVSVSNNQQRSSKSHSKESAQQQTNLCT